MKRDYPPAPRGGDVEVLAGLTFPDPFRALEDGRDPVVAGWQRAQAEIADGYTDGIGGVDRLRDRVARYMDERVASIPRFAGGRWFRPDQSAAGAAQIVVADRPFGAGEVVFAAAEHADSQGRTPFVSWSAPAPDGRLLAVGLCYDGSEANTIRIVDVGSGRLLDDRPPHLLMDNWMGGAQWLADSSAFFYVALYGPGSAFTLRIFRHDIGKPARPDPEPVPLFTTAGLDYVGVFVSRGGRWAVAAQGLVRPKPVAVLDLSGSDGRWRPFLTEIEATVTGHVIGDEYVAVTDHGANRGRVVAIPLPTGPPTPSPSTPGPGTPGPSTSSPSTPGPSTSGTSHDPATWRTVVAESDAVLCSVTPVGDTIYLTELADTYARVRVVGLDGAELGRVPLPGRGALAAPSFPLMTPLPAGHPEEYLFGFSSLTESWGVYRHRPGDSSIETLRPPRARLDAVVEDLWATSPDGTRVPYHVVRRPDVPADAPQPTLVYAYGGYNAPFVPRFPRGMAAFVDAGGVLVHGHLRGGAEFGLDWWRGGRMRNKPNCYADLFAIAEDLIARGRTTAGRLAVTGGSNGGHMAGAAVTLRPDLWRAAVPRVPILDLVGACRDPYGRAAVAEELADPDDPADVAGLAAISPYHLVRDGTAYPAVYLDVGDTDARCPAWHGRKFAARLQEASAGRTGRAGDRPIFLRVWENAGHGWATPKDVEVSEHTAWLAFVIDQLGLTTESLCPPPPA
jgi:prolyl oligopeptidase